MSDRPVRSERSMTVGELASYLTNFPSDMLVLVDGYEDGWDDPVIDVETVSYTPTNAHWEGDYQEPHDGEYGGPPVKALVIGR